MPQRRAAELVLLPTKKAYAAGCVPITETKLEHMKLTLQYIDEDFKGLYQNIIQTWPTKKDKKDRKE